MDKEFFDCVVIGSGPGGYVAAIRAAQKGLKTALVEEKELGGTCLNRGCIPSKTLIANADVLRTTQEAEAFGIQIGGIKFDYAAMKNRKDSVVSKIRKGLEGLIRSNQVKIFNGKGRLISPHEVAITGNDQAVVQARTIILATGSEPRSLPFIACDHRIVHDSTSLLNITELPKKLAVIGGGVIGCEFASLHRTFGVEVIILEMMPSLLPMEGKQIGEVITRAFQKKGIQIITEANIAKVSVQEAGANIQLADGRSFQADQVLVSVGRKFNTENIGLDAAGVVVSQNGTIPVQETMQTNVPHIFAIGDITGKWILAHVASHQGIIAADNAAGNHKKMHYDAVPSVIFTHPEIATIGYTLEKALQAGYNATIGSFPFQALGKAQASIDTEGFAQVVVEEKTGKILGAQVVGHDASNLIAEIAVAMGGELTIEAVADTIHAHPTLAEAWMEAALIASGHPLHMPPKRKASD